MSNEKGMEFFEEVRVSGEIVVEELLIGVILFE